MRAPRAATGRAGVPRHPRRSRERLGLQLALVRRRAASITTIETTDLVPVDLNSLLYGLEQCHRARLRGARRCLRRAELRRARAARPQSGDEPLSLGPGGAILHGLDWRHDARTGPSSRRPCCYPLFTGSAYIQQAHGWPPVCTQVRLLAAGRHRDAPTSTPGNSGTRPTAGRRCSGRGHGLSPTASRRSRTRSPPLAHHRVTGLRPTRASWSRSTTSSTTGRAAAANIHCRTASAGPTA